MSIHSPRISVPRPPAAVEPFRFPIIASCAPVIIAVAIWALTGSLFALIFAALGPVTAIASLVDSRIGGRRTRNREARRFDTDLISVGEEIAAAHRLEAAAIAEVAPSAAMIVGIQGADPYRWNHAAGSAVPLSLGEGGRASQLELNGLSQSPHPSPKVTNSLAQLARAATHLTAPIVADARLGIGVCGPAVVVAALARAAAVQLAWTLPPDEWWYRRRSGAESEWMRALPHPCEPGEPAGGAEVEFGLAGIPQAEITLATAPNPGLLPGNCRVIVEVDDGHARIVEHPDRAARQPVEVCGLSREQASQWAARVGADAVRDGRVADSGAIPDRVDLSNLLSTGITSGGGLMAPVGMDASGPVYLDLVEHGPHAVVGGTTGSGKSELLIAWVLALAATHSPAEVNFLLVDFKGGATFSSLEALKHTVGTITDLDEVTALRALESLRAELKYRERELALAGARSVDEHPGLSRLVIVIDEFQAMLADYPELHSLFSDIAARGRSLGVHLILCTQRPGGVVRDAVLANADVRISLRVNNRSDSAVVVGSEDAAKIPATARGRAVLRCGGEDARPVQFAIADAAVIDAVAQAWSAHPEPRRPWREPLPTRIMARDLPRVPGGIALGMLDLPHEQRWELAVWNGKDSGHLLVAGAPRSGKTATLATIASGLADCLVLSAQPELAWETIAELAVKPAAVTLVIDDLDALLSRLSSDYRVEFVERLTMLLRDGPSWGLSCAVSVGRLSSELSSLAALFAHRLMLAQPSRSDHILAGGDGAHYREGLPPGGGSWHGRRIQVALAGHPLIAARSKTVPYVGTGPLAIVSGRAAQLIREYESRPGIQLVPLDRDVVAVMDAATGQPVVIGDIDQWQANWGALAAVQPLATVVIHACTPAELRAVTRSRELPPLLPAGDSDACWVLRGDGIVGRGRLGSPRE